LPQAPVKVLPLIKSQAFRENFSFNLVFPIIMNLPTKRLHKENVFSINFLDPVQSIIKSKFSLFDLIKLFMLKLSIN
jgi:hypothetical protein